MKKSCAFNLVLFATFICNRLSVMLLFSVMSHPLTFAVELEMAAIFFAEFEVFGVATNGVLEALCLGVVCEIPTSLGVNLSLGDSKCFAANFLAAGDILAIRSVFVLKLKKMIKINKLNQ